MIVSAPLLLTPAPLLVLLFPLTVHVGHVERAARIGMQSTPIPASCLIAADFTIGNGRCAKTDQSTRNLCLVVDDAHVVERHGRLVVHATALQIVAILYGEVLDDGVSIAVDGEDAVGLCAVQNGGAGACALNGDSAIDQQVGGVLPRRNLHDVARVIPNGLLDGLRRSRDGASSLGFGRTCTHI